MTIERTVGRRRHEDELRERAAAEQLARLGQAPAGLPTKLQRQWRQGAADALSRKGVTDTVKATAAGKVRPTRTVGGQPGATRREVTELVDQAADRIARAITDQIRDLEVDE